MFKSSNLLEEKEEENKRSSPLFLTKPSNLETSSRSTNFDISSEEEMFEKRGRTRRITGDYGGTYNPSRSWSTEAVSSISSKFTDYFSSTTIVQKQSDDDSDENLKRIEQARNELLKKTGQANLSTPNRKIGDLRLDPSSYYSRYVDDSESESSWKDSRRRDGIIPGEARKRERGVYQRGEMSRPVSLNKTNEQQKQLTNYQEQVHLKKQNRQLIEENSVLLNEKQAITQNLTELQTVYQSSQQKLEQSQQNYEGTRTILEQLQLDYDDLKEKLKEKIFRLEEVESIFEKQKNYEKSLRDELEIKLDKINSLEKENGEFEQKVSGLEIDQNKLSQELEYVKELQLETNKQNILLQKEKSRLEQDLTELEIISENYYRSSQQSIKQVQNNYSDLQEKLQEVNQLNVELNKKKTQLEKINSELEINLVELNDELNSLQTKFTKQESELMKERQKNRELRENLQREILIKEELIRLQKKLIDSAVEEALSEERIKVKKEEIIRLKNELESLGNDKKKIEKINELSKQVEILENERIKKEGVKNELQTRIKSLITNLDSLESELSESINKIKSKLNLSDKDSDLIWLENVQKNLSKLKNDYATKDKLISEGKKINFILGNRSKMKEKEREKIIEKINLLSILSKTKKEVIEELEKKVKQKLVEELKNFLNLQEEKSKRIIEKIIENIENETKRNLCKKNLDDLLTAQKYLVDKNNEAAQRLLNNSKEELKNNLSEKEIEDFCQLQSEINKLKEWDKEESFMNMSLVDFEDKIKEIEQLILTKIEQKENLEKDISNKFSNYLQAKQNFLTARQQTIEDLKNLFQILKKSSDKHEIIIEVGNATGNIGSAFNAVTFGIPKIIGETIKVGAKFSKMKIVEKVNNEFQLSIIEHEEIELTKLSENFNNLKSLLQLNPSFNSQFNLNNKPFGSKYYIYDILIKDGIWAGLGLNSEKIEKAIISLSENLDFLKNELEQENNLEAQVLQLDINK